MSDGKGPHESFLLSPTELDPSLDTGCVAYGHVDMMQVTNTRALPLWNTR